MRDQPLSSWVVGVVPLLLRWDHSVRSMLLCLIGLGCLIFPSLSMGADPPLIFRGRSGTSWFGGFCLWSSCAKCRRVLPWHGWTFPSLCKELEELKALPNFATVARHLTVRAIYSSPASSNLLKDTLAVKEP